MGKHWLYILYDPNDEHGENKDVLYIGETTRLFRRFNEHMNRRGAVNTTEFRRQRNNRVILVGLYRMDNNLSYYNLPPSEYLQVENKLTEWCMASFTDFEGVIRGGKYTKDECEVPAITAPERPACFCGFPAEVLRTRSGRLMYVCATSNVEFMMAGLGKFYEHAMFDYEVACDFWQPT